MPARQSDTRVLLPAAPVLAAGVRAAAWISTEGEIETLEGAEALRRARRTPPILCHGPEAARRLCSEPFPAYDVLELFAFVHPARFSLPTAKGLAGALDLPIPVGLEDEAETCLKAARVLLLTLAEEDGLRARALVPVATAMLAAGWPWAASVLAALGTRAPERNQLPQAGRLAEGLKVWDRLGEWEDRGPEAKPDNRAITEDAAETRLVELLGPGAEERPEQARYARGVATAFRPPEREGEPVVMLAEAGTGVGKTLGYIAPASVWAETNGAPVWISTFTRNLQRQIDHELTRLYPDTDEKRRRVVVRKGRENYLCLLNLEEAVGRAFPAAGGAARASEGVALGLVARWAMETANGDMIGGDFPAWLTHLFGHGLTLDLTDTRGECIYAGCRHYRKCFIEKSIRRARAADIVVANHALTLVQAARGRIHGTDEEGIARLPLRYVFDEGHHLFAAADGAFSAHLSGREGAELRRWLVGAEAGTRSRARGLRARLEGLLEGDEKAEAALDEILAAARHLPGPGWQKRLETGEPRGEAEAFLAHVRAHTLARADNPDGPFALEAGTDGPGADLLAAADDLAGVLKRMEAPARDLVRALFAKLDAAADALDASDRARIEATARSLEYRLGDTVAAWGAMLAGLAAGVPEGFADWFSLDRDGGRERDVGLNRHWVDPMVPFARVMGETAHGLVVTSATLRDRGDGWQAADIGTGARHFAGPVLRAAEASPFDYASRTRVIVVTDVTKREAAPVAAAYRELFLAAGGGALGLFTAINRLKAIHGRIAGPLEDAGLPLYAQHVDAMDVGTLTDIFRSDENACLFGTDAVRDGIDVPGRSLRLIVFDRVPWPRRGYLDRVRRAAFGGAAWDDMQVRLKLKQAYGRLLRRQEDRGVFILLESLPSRLKDAFPPGVEPVRLGLKEAIAETAAFLGAGAPLS